MNNEYEQNINIEQWVIPYYLENNKNWLISQYLDKRFPVDDWFRNHVEETCPGRGTFEQKLGRFNAHYYWELLTKQLSPENEEKIRAGKEMLTHERRSPLDWHDKRMNL